MAPHLQAVVAQQQQQPQQQQQQQQQPVQNQQQQHSTSTTPQPNNSNNNNNNNNGNGSTNQTQNVAIQQQQQSQNTNNNNTISTAQTYASAALHSGVAGAGGPIPQQAVFNQPIHSANLYMPPPSVHQSHGPMIPAMIPAQMPSNVYVNNVTANVNLHGWAHTVPAYISGAASHYIHGDMPPDQANSVMQPMSAMPVTLAPANAIAAAPLNSGNSSGGISGRGSRRGRGRGGNGGSRRGDYQNQRHPPPEGSPAPTQQMQQTQEQLQLSQQQVPPQHLDPQMLAAGPPHAYHSQYAHAAPYPAYSAYPAYFTSQNPMIHSSQTAAAQHATGTPLFVSPMIYNAHPVYNYGYIYPPVMNAADYPYMTGEEVPGDDRQNPDGMIPQLWHPQHMYAEDFVIQATDMHGHHAGSEDLNHNASSMTSSETPSMVSPNYAVYDPHIHDIQQEMSGMQIYDDQAQMQAMHPNAQPLDEDLSECGGQVTQTIQMVSSGTIITTAPMQMSNEPQVVHHTHTQQTTHHLMQTTLIPIEQATPSPQQQQNNSGAENLIVDNLSNNNNNVNNETSNLQECESMSSLSETHQQSMENIAHDYQQQQQQQQQPQSQQQSVVDISTVDAYNNGNNKMLMTDANELNENVPNVEAAIVPVQSSPQQQHQQQQTSPQQNINFVQQEQQPQQQQQQQPQQIKQQQQQQQQYIIQSYHNQQQQQHHHQQQQQQHHQQQNAQMQSYHSHQHNQQQTQHPHQQQQQHQSYTSHHYESRKQPQAYNNQQSRRKYIPDYGNNNSGAGGGGGGGYQSQQQSHMNNNIETKSMSWTNSAKKSTASVSVTATPNLSNNKQGSGSYSHSTKTYTNQQHHYQHQQHQQQQQQQQNHYNQPQVRNYGAMKMPTSPLGANNATLPTLPAGGVPMNAAATERKNSQVEQPKLNHSNSNVSNSSTNSIKTNNNSSVGAGIGVGAVGGVSPTATAATSTASITAAPHQFAPHQSHQPQQQQQQFAIQQTPTSTATASDNINNNNNININNSKQYPGFTQRKPATQTTVATIVAASANESMTVPPMNLAPPASSNANANTAPTTPSWASLFASNASAAKSTTNVASNVGHSSTGTTAAAAVAAAPTAAVNSTSSTGTVSATNAGTPTQAISKNISGIGSNSTAYPPPFSTKKPIAKVAPYEGITPVTPAPPLVTPGVLSYSAASAQGLPPATTKTTVVPKSEPAATIPNRNAANLDEWTQKYADFLSKYKTDLSPISLRPRGLTNPSNYCYINSILQALIGCSPFYNLIRALPKQAVALSEVKTPTVNAMMSFVNNFSTLPSGLRLRTTKGPKGKDEVGTDLQCDSAFEPTELYKLWDDSRGEHVEGRQEDAEEFLGYVLNKLNDEMLEVIKLIAKPNAEQNGQNEQSENEDGGDVWQMICNNRNKGSVTRQTDFGRTPLSDIFRGELRSRLQREGEHSTDVIQPFFTLQLNIEKAASVKEALEILVGRDQLEGVTGSKSKQEVVAWQQMTLEKLPVVLILHLKWFDYRSDGCTKILKKVEFPVELKIDAKILASKKYSQKQRAYRLFAVVYHDGKTATKGHYITDVFHTGYGSWLRYDDSSVKPVTENHVLLPRAPRVPYLLYYRRSDTLPPQTTVAGGSATFAGGINSAANQSGSRERDNK